MCIIYIYMIIYIYIYIHMNYVCISGCVTDDMWDEAGIFQYYQ